ncbi:MAG: UMP kinase [SAR324 cluster bacterium]|nr:UMP kinase [SAR324 cluster bacterium]
MTPKYKRVLLKLSGEVLGGESGSVFDYEVIERIVDNIIAIRKLNVEIGIVVGGGNIFRGARSAPYKMDRVAGDHMGMLATVINSLCLQDALEQLGYNTRVMSAITMRAIAEPYIKRRADRHLEKGRIVIFAAGTGNPFFTTDTAAVLRATEIGAGVVIKATKTDGVYDKDPNVHSDAIRYSTLSYDEVLEKNLQVMDATAIAFCRDNNLPIIIVDVEAQDSILKTICGDNIGTIIN